MHASSFVFFCRPFCLGRSVPFFPRLRPGAVCPFSFLALLLVCRLAVSVFVCVVSLLPSYVIFRLFF